MKLTKKENPFDVREGQKWKSKDERRQRKFSVMEIKRLQGGVFAVVDYGDLISVINLKRFDRYIKVK